ncbi:uncharacterized protein LOC122240810 [Panthera tigris]|uniref:uncharacterized protein LOC122240810 n=1 Tax=Panthera tigris TaxID=9694 RepID=UPI001C6FAC9A|nr:uncharacterized protein LOC122240810 [Panthera tigris]
MVEDEKEKDFSPIGFGPGGSEQQEVPHHNSEEMEEMLDLGPTASDTSSAAPTSSELSTSGGVCTEPILEGAVGVRATDARNTFLLGTRWVLGLPTESLQVLSEIRWQPPRHLPQELRRGRERACAQRGTAPPGPAGAPPAAAPGPEAPFGLNSSDSEADQLHTCRYNDRHKVERSKVEQMISEYYMEQQQDRVLSSQGTSKKFTSLKQEEAIRRLTFRFIAHTAMGPTGTAARVTLLHSGGPSPRISLWDARGESEDSPAVLEPYRDLLVGSQVSPLPRPARRICQNLEQLPRAHETFPRPPACTSPSPPPAAARPGAQTSPRGRRQLRAREVLLVVLVLVLRRRFCGQVLRFRRLPGAAALGPGLPPATRHLPLQFLLRLRRRHQGPVHGRTGSSAALVGACLRHAKMWKGQLPIFTASKQMSGWARRVTIVGEVQGIEDEDERKEPPNCTHQREKQVFIPLELCLADYLQNLAPSCPSQNKHNLHSEQDRLQVQWSYFGLSDQKMIYTEMRRADLGSRHGNWFRVLNKERRENMTHCSWCNPQGPEKLYFKVRKQKKHL